MKVVILAGGLGTRLSEETHMKPKPMIEIGGKPILWHVMKLYSHYGLNDFIVCCGYKGYMIKEYFHNYAMHNSDLTIDFQNERITFHQQRTEPWKVTLIDTGEYSMTGGRLKRVRNYLNDETFCFTYGDGVSNVNIKYLIDFHKTHASLATVTAVQPPGRYGALDLDGDHVRGFKEKPKGDNNYINGGFFVLEPKVIDYIEDDSIPWERDPLEQLSREGQLKAFKHDGFWQPMDTLRDKRQLEDLWSTTAPWKVWE